MSQRQRVRGVRGSSVGLVVTAIGLGCAPAGAPMQLAPYPAPARTIRRVALVGALIAPSKIDGRPWDGMGDPSELVRGVTGILTANALYGDVAAALAGPAAAALDKPDVGGAAELFINGHAVASGRLSKVQDSFAPQWANLIWDGVDLEMARIRVSLWDMDLLENDPIGVVEVDARKLLEASAVGAVVPVRVNDQNAQVLYISISVM